MKIGNAIAVAGFGVCLLVGSVWYNVNKSYKQDMRRFYKDGFRVGRVVGRDDVLLKLKRNDCFTAKLDDIIVNQDAQFNQKVDAAPDLEAFAGDTAKELGKKK